MDQPHTPRIAFFTLGCKLNFSESSYLANLMAGQGYERVEFGTPSDVVVLNTCSVTAAADKKCRNMIHRATRNSPGALIVVTGCFANLAGDTIRQIPGVDLILTGNEKFNLPLHLERIEKRVSPEIISCEPASENLFFPSYSLGDRTRSFLKVQDGCDYSCSYCTIPKARGGSRSPSVSSLLGQVREIAAAGVREVVLTGVNTGDFGRHSNENFFDLIRQLETVEGIERFRISSIEPNLLTREMIEWIAGSFKFVPHFHIPLQSGSNRILGLMQRRYQREVFAQRITEIREISPLAAIGADVIVGFPGETEEDFQETFDFLSCLNLSYLHVFSFSARPGTPAAAFPGKVAPAEKENRSKVLHALSEKMRLRFYQENIGRTGFVLVEQQEDSGWASGFTANYIRVDFQAPAHSANHILQVKLEKLGPEGSLSGRILGEI